MNDDSDDDYDYDDDVGEEQNKKREVSSNATLKYKAGIMTSMIKIISKFDQLWPLNILSSRFVSLNQIPQFSLSQFLKASTPIVFAQGARLDQSLPGLGGLG